MERLEGTVQSLFSSPVRTMILLSLEESHKTLSQLAAALGFSAGTVYHRLKELKGAGFVQKEEGFYSLTALGVMGALKTRDTMAYLQTMEKFKKFFSAHEIEALPHPFLLRVAEIASCELYHEGVDPLRPIALISNVFEGACSKIHGVSTIGTSEWARILERKSEEAVDISLVVTDEVYGKIRSKSSLLEKKASILTSPVRFVLVLTETTMLLALNKKDILDMTNIIVGKDKSALEWGAQLFSFERQGVLSQRI